MTNSIGELELNTYNKQVEDEAKVLINHALLLSNAFNSKKQEELLYALDSNLKLWVEIETSVKDKKNSLPEQVKRDIASLAKFIERLILSKGLNITKEDMNSIVNANTQLSNGILERGANTFAVENAISLLENAVMLSSAQESKDAGKLAYAIDSNMKLWTYIKTVAKSKENKFPKEIKDNIVKLADYVTSKSLEVGKNINNYDSSVLDSMVNVNLQISEGLVTNRVA